jgi:hypothetical protein
MAHAKIQRCKGLKFILLQRINSLRPCYVGALKVKLTNLLSVF